MRNVQRILNSILSKNVFEYILIDRDANVGDFSLEATHLLGEKLVHGESIFDVLPELVGSEDVIEEIFNRGKQSYAIKTVEKNGRFLNIYLDYFDSEKLLILLQDITEVTEIRRKIMQVSNQTTLLSNTLQSIVDSQKAIIFLVDSNGKIVFANKRFHEYFDTDDSPELRQELLHTLLDEHRDFHALHKSVRKGKDELRIGQDVFSIESVYVDPVNILFTLTPITDLVRKKEALQNEIRHDPLTGVLRKQSFDEELRKRLLSKRPFALVVTDIDNFKQINDRYGHVIGDKALIQFTEVIRKRLRDDETIARWGGEEFLLLLECATPEEAIDKCETIRRDLEQYRFEAGLHITASFGVSCPHEGDDAATLVERADKALYQAKSSGKNRVVFLN